MAKRICEAKVWKEIGRTIREAMKGWQNTLRFCVIIVTIAALMVAMKAAGIGVLLTGGAG